MVEEQEWSIITGSEGYDSLFSLNEFTDYLGGHLSLEKSQYEGRVLWSFWRVPRGDKYEQSEYATKIKRVLVGLKYSDLVQFWAPKVDDDGGHHYLTTSDQPFSVGSLRKGYCWYRKKCMDHRFAVEEGAKEEQLGAVGRVYRNKHPESSPDLRLYSIQEFPLRDYAGRSGLRKYLALPVFDSLNNQCCGVLEVLSFDTPIWEDDFLTLNRRLQAADLRSTNSHFFPIRRDLLSIILPPKYKEQPEREISKMLELAIKAVPQLHLAQVWVPLEQCAIVSNNSCCMERAAFITADNETVNSCENIDSDMFDYLQACEFHNLQIGKGIARALMPSSNSKSGICGSLCDISISENPMAHYAQKARLSLWFAVSLGSLHNSNDIYVVEFFLQSNCREDAYCDSSRHLLLRVMERELKSYKFELGGEVVEEMVAELRQPNAIEYESTEHVQEMNYQLSELEFANYLQKADLCCLRPSEEFLHGWVSCSPAREESYEHDDVNSNSSLVLNLMKDQWIKRLMNGIASKLCHESYSLVQFWAPKMEEEDDRCYLETSEQPYALGCLGKGLALFRKQSMEHCYFVDVEEELGPPGRVFRNRQPEITPDLRLYSTREFSLRNHAVNCSLRKYCALPVFDLHQHQCVGVLEFLEFGESITFEDIGQALKAANLSSAHIDFNPIFLAIHLPANVAECRKQAFTEIKEALRLVTEIPQLYKADVWVPCGQCASVDSNLSCMELIFSTESVWEICLPTNVYRHVQTNKGIAGMLLASKNRACFVRNSCDFSIAEQPLAHYAQRARLDVCFAICLQSSHTGDLLYVVEFFLNQGPATYEYLGSFLNFLLPMMKQKLNSFKIASGKQLGEELVVEVIQFSEASKLTSPELHLPNIFPLEFETVQYGQKEHQHTKDESVACVSDGMDSDTSVAQATRCSTAAESSKKEDAAKKKGRGKRKTGPGRLTLEDLEPHFGKRLEDVEEALKVGRSTIKRACRYYGIERWPKHKKNSSLFETESANESAPDSQQNMWRPSSSSNLLPLDMSLHQNVPQTDSEITQQYRSVQSEPEKVIIKATYQDDTIRFDFSLSSGMSKLVEEVATGLNLKVGSFKLKYLDEDNEHILLARDPHLQLCLKSLTAGGTFIRLSVHLISK